MSVSFWVQGCPFHCSGCHNPESWDYEGGKELPPDYVEQVIKALGKNSIQRNLSILGGEPLCERNLGIVSNLVTQVKAVYPNIKVYVWTGYTLEQLEKRSTKESELREILDCTDVLIDGLYEESLRDVRLKLRGSSNQRIFIKRGRQFYEDSSMDSISR